VILQRYILRELLGSFVFAFSALLAVCLLGTSFQVFRTFPGLGFEILVKTLPLATGAMATWVTLVASCTSSTLVYARLSAENEITAMRTCGIHAGRITAPALLLGLILVGGSYPLNEYVVPWTRHHQRVLFREATEYALRYPPAGNQDFRIGNMRITYVDYQDGRMKSPTITKVSREQKLVMDYYAESGLIMAAERPIRVVLTKPRGWQINDKGQEERFSAENDVSVDVSTEEYDRAPRQDLDKPSSELWDAVFKDSSPAQRNPILMILHTRYAASLAPLLFVLVGMPIGILVRRGSRLAGLGAALPPLLVYFVTYFIFQGLGDKNHVHPLFAAYAPDAVLALLASALQWGIARR
jgi:lipopolysaccharide export LptBFGC system permease protein LptF